ncbi:MAG: thioredoxin family protein [Bacillota bacterium]
MSTESVITIDSNGKIKQLMAGEKPFILYFSSSNCNVCHAILPKLINLVDDYPIKVARINIDEHAEIAGQFLIFTVPTILIMHKGKEIFRESRFIDFQKVEKTLNLLSMTERTGWSI